MNPIELLVAELGLDANCVLNVLQLEVGLVSDLCLTLAEVAEADGERAVPWVWEHARRLALG